MKIIGMAEIWQLDVKTGNIKKYIKKHNTVLTNGKNYFWSNKGVFSYIGIGTDSTAPDVSQTGLIAEVRREALTKERTDNVITVYHTFIDWTDSTVITEAGIALANDNTHYFNRVTFDGVTCDDSNNIKIKFTVTITD